MKKIKYSLLTFFLFSVSIGFARDASQELIDLLGKEPNVSINLGANLLNLAMQFSDEKEELKRLVSSLDSISVNVYELDSKGDASAVTNWLDRYVSSSKRNGLSEIVKVVEDDERVHIMADVTDSSIEDLSILVHEKGDELVYISIRGMIELNAVSDLLDHFNVNGLADLDIDIDF